MLIGQKGLEEAATSQLEPRWIPTLLTHMNSTFISVAMLEYRVPAVLHTIMFYGMTTSLLQMNFSCSLTSSVTLTYAVQDLFLSLHQHITLTWWHSEPDIILWTRNMTVLKEAMFQDRAMGEIHKLLPRLYRFTKIPYAQCTSLNKSKFILRDKEMKSESTYNVCFQWSQFAGEASSHTEASTM